MSDIQGLLECDDLPPFDLCLTMSKNPWGGPKKYYSTNDPDSAALAPFRERIETLAGAGFTTP